MPTKPSETQAERDEAFRAKIAREDRWRRKLRSPRDRLWAWVDMIFVDHAFFRFVYLNRHRVSDAVWRAAQPWPHQIRAMARRGVRTIVNLRGGQSYGSLPLEIDACDASGLAFETFVLRSRSLPTVDELRDLQAFFGRLEYPLLSYHLRGS
ncbi:MAG: hypothetical protein AAGH68_04635 [Pseudomonadota bacterium]